VPEVPACCVVAVFPALVQLKTVFVALVLNPVGRVAVAPDKELKFSVTAVPAVVIDF
jgi:hypothetical protein